MQVVSTPAPGPAVASSRRAVGAASASGMNAPSPTFTSSTSRRAPAASFLDMMLVAISGNRRHRGGDVAQRVERADRPAPGAGSGRRPQPRSRTPGAISSARAQLGAEAGNRLELVERATGVAEAAAATAWRSARRRRRPAARRSAWSCRRPHRSSACRRPAGRPPTCRAAHQNPPSPRAAPTVSASLRPLHTTAIRNADT